MSDARKRKIDVVLCWRFDRFARSTVHLLNALEEFRSLGIGFASVQEAIDTTTAAGKLTFVVLGAVAELERAIIRERIQMGVANAKRRGKRLGRPPIRTLCANELEKVRSDRATGKFSLRALAPAARSLGLGGSAGSFQGGRGCMKSTVSGHSKRAIFGLDNTILRGGRGRGIPDSDALGGSSRGIGETLEPSSVSKIASHPRHRKAKGKNDDTQSRDFFLVLDGFRGTHGAGMHLREIRARALRKV